MCRTDVTAAAIQSTIADLINYYNFVRYGNGCMCVCK